MRREQLNSYNHKVSEHNMSKFVYPTQTCKVGIK
jgi:hypothetical protein